MTQLRVMLNDAVSDRQLSVMLPNDVPLAQLIPALARKLGLPEGEYTLTVEGAATPLAAGVTLAGAGVSEGATLRLERTIVEAPPIEAPPPPPVEVPPAEIAPPPVPIAPRAGLPGRVVKAGIPIVLLLVGLALPLYLRSRVVDTFQEDGSFAGITFSPDGSTLALWTDNTISLRDIQNGERRQTISDREGGIVDITYSPHGDHLFAHRRDTNLEALDAGGLIGNFTLGWEVASGNPIGSFPVEDKHNGLTALASSPDGETYAVGYFSDKVVIMGLETEEKTTLHPSASLNLIDDHYNMVHSMAFSPDGKSLAVQLWLGELIVYDVETGRTLLTLNPRVHVGDIACRERYQYSWFQNIIFSPDGRFLVSRDTYSAKILLWEVDTGDLRQVLGHDSSESYPTVISPDGRMMATSCCGEAYLVDLSVFDPTSCSDNRLNHCPDSTAGFRELDIIDYAKSLAFSPDGSLLAIGDMEPEVLLFDGQTGKKIRTLTNILAKHTYRVTDLDFSPDSTMLASTDELGKVILWDVSR
jgi:WD40 repeat protein